MGNIEGVNEFSDLPFINNKQRAFSELKLYKSKGGQS